MTEDGDLDGAFITSSDRGSTAAVFHRSINFLVTVLRY
jgi:hypothetical protein